MDNKPTILQKIINDKIEWVKNKKAALPLAQFQDQVQRSERDFYQALSQGTHQRPAYILECKKASPSKGLIRDDFNLAQIANVYKHYASAISVLTDEKYFQGNFDFIAQVRSIAPQPILCKDFMIDEYQVYLARYHQADAILLMLSVVDDATYLKLANLAHDLGMGVLTETSNQAELERAVKLNARVIGINNRDLHDLSVDLKRTPPLAQQIPADRIIISESGIYNHQQIQQLKPYVHAFLIGSSLMGDDDLQSAVRQVIYGENKVCGLTRAQDVKAVYQHGALYGGMIFAEKSPRKVSLEQAKHLINAAPLRFVGVFQNQDLAYIADIAHQLKLFAVQLHGNESHEFMQQLRDKLPTACQIWNVISVDIDNHEQIKLADDPLIDRFLFDSKVQGQQGGTGLIFDWTLIPHNIKKRTILAGGIKQENIEQALIQGCLGVDVNSGVEIAPGIKDEYKIAELLDTIIRY
ncbi:bifunctional indole-3-glycerol-phosphate synthase TrpC/phosphoribosylanthranilate isomerase TrpF [Testudinibacter sp. TR-2022]|uniref:bifunctional indole-3-glycerol-phosphate synthase TrpC/phosphoribosylanthranilate isomerase TrpF n=1 Tax=Testudinibacter sp. TR-2022 TaxID=2585029 RepID=UPI00111805C1|nr:bifunctional indole-3-glycerol-phosphate synthase TrpC/phosphoribosylanthranilate isomerase TrpF [Testudinibacter sp. TR-2022]TNH04463.1 bifunctional indole-3-glycerol-phosphate synthase TrpC/phosphoribosylanthranilate isomerase TrpF [Pasteurellaceae bacterium Phil31]TNH12015.1 bifunctional indole-3-glycerol-phosphate synthase TrpC/phosphoribosylanthranilate isomerase TrpF [Testudinibacter sp. TR-2022]TNH12680.1 bifunctional indole-3-glycerol-phosphate synthase TrpC/phosphoribosylanthranilate